MSKERFYQEGQNVDSQDFSQEDFAEMVKDAAVDTAVNTVNLISVLDPKVIEPEEVRAISDATGATPEFVENVVGATDEATEAFSQVENEEEVNYVSQAFSDLVDEITRANFSQLAESVVNFSQNFSENFDEERVVDNVVKIAGAIDPKAVENLGKDKIVEVISEATKVPEEATSEIVDAVVDGGEEIAEAEEEAEDAGLDEVNCSEEDFSESEDFSGLSKILSKFSRNKSMTSKIIEGAKKYSKNAKKTIKGWSKAVTKEAKAINKKLDKKLGKYKIPALVGSGLGLGAAAYGVANYSDVTLYTKDGIPVHFDNLEVEESEQSMPEMPNPNPVINNGGILQPQVPEDVQVNPVVAQNPANAAIDPQPGQPASDDASQALAAAAVKQDLVTASTMASGTVNASQYSKMNDSEDKSEQFSVLDSVISKINNGELK